MPSPAQRTMDEQWRRDQAIQRELTGALIALRALKRAYSDDLPPSTVARIGTMIHDLEDEVAFYTRRWD